MGTGDGCTKEQKGGLAMATKRTSSWADRSEQRRASARKYSDLSDELGSIFRDAQQEAHAQWSAWGKEMDEQEEIETGGVENAENPNFP
jgi:hypothetical protein